MATQSLFIENGRVVDPSQQIDRIANVLIVDDKIVGVDVSKDDVPAGAQRIDAVDKIVTPGLVDMHAHLREPGYEEAETVATGARAALCGGFTSIACPPNTNPPIDTQAQVALIRELATSARQCNVFPICCISKERKGQELAELGLLFESGAVACSDDGNSVEDSELMRRALEYCKMFNKAVLCHEESAPLAKGGIMHEGFVSNILGLRGIPSEAEDVMVTRDVALAESVDAPLHIMHVSSAGAIAAIRRAKERNVKITAEVTPHHITLTDEELRSFDSNFKMNPPLRSREHVDACVKGLVDGVIDAIATDHAPHSAEKKQREIDIAPFGIIGLESALPLAIETLIDSGLLTWSQLVEKMSLNPSKILRVAKGTLQTGADADVTVIDPNLEWTFSVDQIHSKSQNTPYLNRKMKGRAVMSIVSGEIRYRL
ncbi:MAG: dihydroorotase [Thermoguttaceae bacterium]|nr:dihydroorotase [Thermoguttaceae bacterium]